jgi:hypothetical protein
MLKTMRVVFPAPAKEKRPWGAGVFRTLVHLGSWVFKYSRGDFGGQVKSRVNSVKLDQRTTEAFELVTASGLPALMTWAVWA